MSKLKECPACGKEVSSSAKTCPHCGQKLKRGWFVKLLFGIIILIVIGVIFGPTAEEEAQQQQIVMDNIKHSEASKISASGEIVEIFRIMSENTDIQRDNKEKELTGKIIQWELTVYEVSKNSDGTYTIQTEDDNKVNTFIQLYPQNEEEITYIEKLKTGNYINIKGEITGTTLRNIDIDPAILIY